MPVWGGQGYNSGIRDANNIAWKLAAVVKGVAGDGLLDTYDTERRAHAAAMISLSVTASRIFSPTSRWVAALRDVLTLALNVIPPVKNYFLQMRFKPMPRYVQGVVVHEARAGKIPAASPVGRLFIQPDVATVSGQTLEFDDAIGNRFAVMAWATDPRRYMSRQTLDFWNALGAHFVSVMPAVQMSVAAADSAAAGLLILGDASGDLKQWFGAKGSALVVLRPDRFVAAAAGSPQIIDGITGALKSAMHATAPVPTFACTQAA
jgi:3-(3-hydroxy-phenyl)propionate hydroxylase